MSQRQFKLDTMLYRLYKKPDKDLFFYGNNHLIALWELQQQISMVTSLSNSTIDKKCDFTVSLLRNFVSWKKIAGKIERENE